MNGRAAVAADIPVPVANGDRARVDLPLAAVGKVLVLSTWFSAAATLPGLRVDLGLTPGAERWAIVAVQLGFAVAAAVVAATGIVDRVGTRRLVVSGAAAAALANVAPLVAPNVEALLTGRLVVGISLALVYPPLLRAVVTGTGVDRGRALGTMIGALTLGSASPHLVNGFGGANWRLVLGVTSIAAVCGAVASGLAVPRTVQLPRVGRVTAAEVAQVWRSRVLRGTCLAYIGHVWELYAGWALVAPLMLALWTSPRAASLLTFAVIGAGAVAAPVGGHLGDRLGARRAAIVAMTTSGLLVLAIGLALPWPHLATGLAVVWGIAVIADGPAFPALAGVHAPPTLVGSALALQLSLGFGATALATWVVPLVREGVGWVPALLVLAPGPALGALALHRLAAVDVHDPVPTRLVPGSATLAGGATT